MMSVTDLEIEEAIRTAWTILYTEPAASPVARRLAAALLAITEGTPTHPHWVTPDDLWRDRLAVLAEQNALYGAFGVKLIIAFLAPSFCSIVGTGLVAGSRARPVGASAPSGAARP